MSIRRDAGASEDAIIAPARDDESILMLIVVQSRKRLRIS